MGDGGTGVGEGGIGVGDGGTVGGVVGDGGTGVSVGVGGVPVSVGGVSGGSVGCMGFSPFAIGETSISPTTNSPVNPPTNNILFGIVLSSRWAENPLGQKAGSHREGYRFFSTRGR